MMGVFLWWICHALSWYVLALILAMFHSNNRAMTIGNAMGAAVFSVSLQYLAIHLLRPGACF